MFPEQQMLPAEKEWLSKTLDQKILESTLYTICSFYEGFTILQIYGNESKEYFFGNYFNGKYCGHIYAGEKFTQLEVAKACDLYMPKDLQNLKDYILEFGDKIWYHLIPNEQYAWVYDRIVTKVK